MATSSPVGDQRVQPQFCYGLFGKKGIEKHLVEHTIYNWSVASEVWRRVDCVSSPRFWTGSSLSSAWLIKFYPQHKIGNCKGIGLSLHRLEVDEGPGTVMVTYRFGLASTTGNKIWFQEKIGIPFQKSYVQFLQTSILEQLEDFFPLPGDNTLIILCEIYISFEEQRSNSEESSFKDLIALSEDLINSYIKKHCPKILLRVFDKDFRVHSSVLTARSNVFSRMLQNKATYLEFPDVNRCVMDTLLCYVYSGNLCLTQMNNQLATGLYECAVNMGISGLNELLLPTLIFNRTTALVEEFDFMWSIENFLSLEYQINQKISSPEFRTQVEKNHAWSLTVYPRGTWNLPDVLRIDVQPVSSDFSKLYVSVEISLLDSDAKQRFTKRHTIPTDSVWECSFPHFIERRALSLDKNVLLPEKTLNIKCNLKTVSAKNVASTNACFFRTTGDYSLHLEYLSNDLGALFKEETLTDFVLEANGRLFRSHNDILQARTTLCDSSRRLRGNFLRISGFRPEILERMLIYVYTGKMQDLSCTDAMDLWRMARKYDVHFLKSKCISFLISSLDIPSVFEVLCFAHCYHLSALKTECLAYISNRSEEAFADDAWNYVRIFMRDLAREILEFHDRRSSYSRRFSFYQYARRYLNENNFLPPSVRKNAYDS